MACQVYLAAQKHRELNTNATGNSAAGRSSFNCIAATPFARCNRQQASTMQSPSLLCMLDQCLITTSLQLICKVYGRPTNTCQLKLQNSCNSNNSPHLPQHCCTRHTTQPLSGPVPVRRHEFTISATATWIGNGSKAAWQLQTSNMHHSELSVCPAYT